MQGTVDGDSEIREAWCSISRAQLPIASISDHFVAHIKCSGVSLPRTTANDVKKRNVYVFTKFKTFKEFLIIFDVLNVHKNRTFPSEVVPADDSSDRGENVAAVRH